MHAHTCMHTVLPMKPVKQKHMHIYTETLELSTCYMYIYLHDTFWILLYHRQVGDCICVALQHPPPPSRAMFLCEKPADAMFTPCGDVVTCASRMKRCPLCKVMRIPYTEIPVCSVVFDAGNCDWNLLKQYSEYHSLWICVSEIMLLTLNSLHTHSKNQIT